MTLLRRCSVAGSLALASAVPAAAQSDPTLQRLWRLGMDSSHVQQLSQTLFDSIGPRLTGSPGIRAASDWVINQYKAWGIDARREQYGTWRGWRRGVSHIDLIEPRVRSLAGTMLAWSPGTNGRPVQAEAIVLPKFSDSTEFVKWLPKAKGKIVLLSPAWPTCRPSEDWNRFGTPASIARMDTLIAQMNMDWSVMGDSVDGPFGRRVLRPDSTKLYRGTGYSLALGTGTLGMRLEKAGVAGMISSRNKLSGFTTPFAPAADAGGGAVVVVRAAAAADRCRGARVPAAVVRHRVLRRPPPVAAASVGALEAPVAGAPSKSSRRTTRPRRP